MFKVVLYTVWAFCKTLKPIWDSSTPEHVFWLVLYCFPHLKKLSKSVWFRVPTLTRETVGGSEEKSESESHSVVSNSLQPHGLYSPWNSPGKNTGVGSLSFLQGIFPTQGSNPGLLHCRQILYQLSHKGSPKRSLWEFLVFFYSSVNLNLL